MSESKKNVYCKSKQIQNDSTFIKEITVHY